MNAAPSELTGLLAERPLLGTFVSLRDPASVSLCAAAGFDTVVIDGEHGSMNPETIGHLALAARSAGIPAIVRVGTGSRVLVQQVLESGADAVMVPMVEDPGQAAAFASFCRYPPTGTRGFHPLTGGSRYGAIPPAELARVANERLVAIAQIETARGLDACEDIALVPGIDMLFFGPGDMSLSLGVPPSSPKLAAALERVASAARDAGKVFGTFVGNDVEVKQAIALGARLVVAGADVAMLMQSARSWVAALAPKRGGA